MKRILLLFIPVAFATAGHSQITTLNAGPTITALGGVDSAEFFLQKGLTEKQNGRRLESLKYFEKAATYDANSRTILTELAQAYLDLRRYALARESFKKLVTLGDESAATYKQLMMLSYQLKQSDDVILYADKLSKIDPSEKIAFYVGKVHYDNDNYGDAIRFLTKAMADDPANAEAPYLIARSYADMSNYKQCIPFFQKAIELNPGQPYWVYELGLIYYAMNDDKNALKYIIEAGDKGYKKDNDYLENLAIAYLNVGELDKGVAMLQEILKRRPSDMNILGMVAEAYYAKGRFDQSMEYYDKMLEFDKQNASALYMIGMCYQKKGGKENMEKGTKLCDTAIIMDPSLSNLKQKKQMMGM
ncbi:MAG: tetratricopeptide repeat protein [Chitinophagaceae bacterium]|nr:tetratricopeptide repeat protein [Chitinophagaceae bacterium]